MGVVAVCLGGGGEYYLSVSVCVECFFWANDGCVTMSVVSSRMVNGE